MTLPEPQILRYTRWLAGERAQSALHLFGHADAARAQGHAVLVFQNEALQERDKLV